MRYFNWVNSVNLFRLKSFSKAVAIFATIAALPLAYAEAPSPSAPQVNTLLQTWLVNNTTSATAAKPNFRIRRAEIRLSSNVTETTRWLVMFDVAKTLNSSADNKILQDAAIAWKIIPELELALGQFKVQTTAESLEKSSELLFPDRSIEARTYGDYREIGFLTSYRNGPIQFSGMLSNGTGYGNSADTTGPKDLSARLDYDIGYGIKAGAFTQASDFSYSKKGSTGINAKVILGELMVRSEYVSGCSNSVGSNALSADISYMINEQWQPAFRFNTVTPNSTSPVAGTSETFGLNYFLAKTNFKLQTSFALLKNLAGSDGTPTYQLGATGTQFILAGQAAF